MAESRLEFPGLHPQRFSGGRKHMRPADTIQEIYDSTQTAPRGRKHYDVEPTPFLTYKPGIKIWPGRSQLSHMDEPPPKKLIYIPAKPSQKKGSHALHLEPIKPSTVPKLSQQQKLIIEQQMECKRAVDELDQWEAQQRLIMRRR